MNRTLYQLIFWALLSVLASHTAHAQTAATNVQLRTDPVVRKVLIEYDLPQSLPGDSIYIELETAAGRILRPLTVRGDVGKGIKAGSKKLVAWDVVQDNIRLDETVTVLLRVAQLPTAARPGADVAVKPVEKPAQMTPKKSPLPLIGWVAGAGLTGYATLLALGLNKDVKAYNSKPFAENAAELQRYQDQKSSIDSRKGTFTIVAGAAVAVVVGNVIYTLIRKKAAGKTSLLIQSGNQLTSIGVGRRF